MPKIESEKIECFHRPCSRPAPRGKIKSVRTHSEVIEQFDSFSLLKLLFLVRNWHCWSRKAFPRQMTPQSREKTAKRRFFDIADRHEKLYGQSRLYASAQGRHETGGVYSLFSSLSFDISIKTACRGDLQIFKACFVKKKQTGKYSGKQWSLHVPLKVGVSRYSVSVLAILCGEK